jgi:hypothetical protein
MTRANYHWSRTAVLHVGVDPDVCADCQPELDGVTGATAGETVDRDAG